MAIPRTMISRMEGLSEVWAMANDISERRTTSTEAQPCDKRISEAVHCARHSYVYAICSSRLTR